MDRIPPQAIEAEKAVLGAMLIEKEAIESALELLKENFFYKEAHRQIFRAVQSLYDQGKAVDIVTVSEELRRLKTMQEVGGAAYLSELINTVSTAAHVGYYARIVRDKGFLREIIQSSTRIVQQCYEEGQDATVILDQAEKDIFSIAQQQTVHGFQPAAELAHRVIERLEAQHQRKTNLTGVASGYTDLDNLTSGFQKSDLIILAARPSQGKTALALNVAAHAATAGLPVAIFSLEMSSESIFTRLICSKAGANLHEIRRGFFRREHWSALTSSAAQLAESPLYIDDTPGLSMMEIRSRARRLAADLKSQNKELSLIIVDYLQLMRAGGGGRFESRQVEVSEISRGLKNMARDLDVPVVALSQLSRRVEEQGRGGRPQLSDLRESGSLEQDADVVMFIYREGYYKPEPDNKNKAEIIVAKQRNGPTDNVPLFFRFECTRFENLSPEHSLPSAEDAEAVL